jgi:hypothetical protein
MTQEQAIEILNQALDQGFKKGVYSLQDAAYLVQALAVLFPPQPQEVVELTKED